MSAVIKINGTEQWVNTTANTFNSNTWTANTGSTGTGSPGRMVVRLLNIDTAPHLITQANTTGTIGTITVGANSEIYLEKFIPDTLVSNSAANAILGVFISYKN